LVVVRVSGAILLTLVAAKALDPSEMMRWLANATAWPANLCWITTFVIIGYEAWIGALAATAPKSARVSFGSLLLTFALFHGISLWRPELGRCPCLGPFGHAIDAQLEHIALGSVCMFIGVLCLLSRPRNFAQRGFRFSSGSIAADS
jgi:hypothetical protein